MATKYGVNSSYINGTYDTRNSSYNISSDDLEHMARQVNNDKQRRTASNYKNFKTQSSNLNDGIISFNKLKERHKHNDKKKIVQNGYFNAQGEYFQIDGRNYGDSGIHSPNLFGVDQKPNNVPYQEYTPTNMNGTLIKDIMKNRGSSNSVISKLDDSKQHTNKRSNVGDHLNDDHLKITLSESDNLLISDSESESSNPLNILSNSNLDQDNNDYDNITQLSNDLTLNTNNTNGTLNTTDIIREIKEKSKYKVNHTSPDIFNGSSHDIDMNHKGNQCDDFDLDSVDSIESLESGESLLKHIQHCNSCKTKVIELIKRHKHDKLHEKNENGQRGTFSDMKDLLIVCLIGFLIIIILDFTLGGM
jgi:hypothetical protein